MENVMLKINNLTTEFKTEMGNFPAVSGINLTINRGKLCVLL